MIILLILVGITINTLTNNGIFEKAKEARDKWQNAQNDEETQIAKYTNDIDSYVGGNRDYTPISYSTDEQDTGLKWLNGETIYQISIQKSYSSNSDYVTFTNTTEFSIAGKKIISITGMFYNDDGDTPSGSANSEFVQGAGTIMYKYNRWSNTSGTAICTVQYIKTATT